MQINQNLYKKIFIFFAKKIFFTAGYCSNLVKIKKYKLTIRSINAKLFNKELHNRFNNYLNFFNVIINSNINNYRNFKKYSNYKNLKNLLSELQIKQLKKDFTGEINKYQILFDAYNANYINYIDQEMTLLISPKIKKVNQIIVFNCGGRISNTIYEEDYYLQSAHEINLAFPDMAFENFYLNMPSQPKSLDQVARKQFQVIKNIIYIKKISLDNVIILGYSLGGLVSAKIIEQIKKDPYFANQKLLAYINIASFCDIVNLLKIIKIEKQNAALACKLINFLASKVSMYVKQDDNNFIKDWKTELNLFIDNQDMAQFNFFGGLDFDECIPDQCSITKQIFNNFFKNKSNKNQPKNIVLFFYNNLKMNNLHINHENCKNIFFIEIIRWLQKKQLQNINYIE